MITLDLQELQELAKQGNTEEQVVLGILYLTGEGGVDLDYKKAELWFKLAAKKGHSDAQHFLGVINKEAYKIIKKQHIGLNNLPNKDTPRHNLN